MALEPVYAFAYEGKRYDCGSKEGFLQATVELALQHPQVGQAFRDYLRNLAIQGDAEQAPRAPRIPAAGTAVSGGAGCG